MGPPGKGRAVAPPAEIGEHPRGVQDGGRLHDPADHEIAEGLVTDRPEPELLVDASEHIEQQP